MLSTPRRLLDSMHASTTLSGVVRHGEGVNFVATTGRRGATASDDDSPSVCRASFTILPTSSSVSPHPIPSAVLNREPYRSPVSRNSDDPP